MRTWQIAAPALAAVSFLASSVIAQDPKQALQEKVAALKQSMAQNQAALRQYSWTARTEISLKGEVKKTTESLCRYGPDGKVQKTPLGAPAAQAQPQSGGGRQRRGGGALKEKVVEKKKDEMEDYMERAVALIHNYVSPSPERIQAAVQAGNVSLGQAGGDQVQIKFSNYLKSGDAMVLTLDKSAKALRRVAIDSYLDDQKDAVALHVDFATLPDGPNYAAATTFTAAAKKIQVVTRNSNYQKIAQ